MYEQQLTFDCLACGGCTSTTGGPTATGSLDASPVPLCEVLSELMENLRNRAVS